MACWKIDLEAESKARAKKAIKDLAERLRRGEASIVIDKVTGAIAFRGWRGSDVGLADTCAFRRLMNDPEGAKVTRDALRAAERVAGRAYSPQAVAAGTHSHDGGRTWGPGH